jgi:hypothetical protein
VLLIPPAQSRKTLVLIAGQSDDMKKILPIILLFLVTTSYAQLITNVKYSKSTSDYKVVSDSIERLFSPDKTIKIIPCEKHSEWLLVEHKDGWKGIFIQRIDLAGMNQSDEVFIDNNGVKHLIKAFRTKLMSFDADSLSKVIVTKDLFQIEQLTEDSLNEILTKNLNPKKENVKYSLGNMSHDCNMTIVVGNNSKYASYRNYVVSSKEIHTNKTIKTFYDIREVLKKLGASYKH